MSKTIFGMRFESSSVIVQDAASFQKLSPHTKVNVAGAAPKELHLSNAAPGRLGLSPHDLHEKQDLPIEQLQARLTATNQSQVGWALAGTTLAMGKAFSLPATTAGVGVATTRLLDTALKWGGNLIKLTPWGRAVTLVAGVGVAAYESGALNKFFPKAEAQGPSHHALLGPPPGMHGGKEEFPMVDDGQPTVHGGAALPKTLADNGIEGYVPTSDVSKLGLHVGGGQVQVASIEGGFVAVNPPKGNHILLAQSVKGDEAVKSKSAAAPSKKILPRPGIAEYPAAPKPEVDFSDEINVAPYPGVQLCIFDYKFPAPKGSKESAEIMGSVVDGVLICTIRVTGDPTLRPSASDVLINSINALKKRGVDIYEYQSKWETSEEYGNEARHFDRALKKLDVSRESAEQSDLLFAASQTWTGKMLKQYGLFPQSVLIEPSSGNVITKFRNPLLTRIYGEIGKKAK